MADESGRTSTWRGRDMHAWGAALGGTTAWLGVVLSAALNYRRATVPFLWWVLCVVVLVCFLALSGNAVRRSRRDRLIFAVLTLSAIGANAVWGADLMSGVLLVLVAGMAGWVLSTRATAVLMLSLTAALAILLALQNATVVWALLYGTLLFFAALMVNVVVREQAARREAADVAAQLELANAQLTESNAALRRAQERLAAASKAEERLRISRDLHDGMGNQLTALSLQLDLLGRHVDGPAQLHLRQAQSLATELLQDTRGIVSHLRGGRSSPRDQIARLARSLPSPETSLDLDEGLDRAPGAVGETIVRVVQESLTNAARHAGADRAWVTITRAAGAITVQVRDNGRGVASVTPGNGLAGMTERVAAQGGDVEFSSAPGAGFTVIARIPLDPAGAEPTDATTADREVNRSMAAPAPSAPLDSLVR